MAIKNDGYIESLPDDASIGLIEDVKRKASAIKETAKVTAAVEEVEVTKEQSAATDAGFKKAGAEQEAKFAEGNPEGNVVTEGVLNSSPAANIATNLGEQLLADKTNPSKSSNVDVKEAKARGAVSMEDLTKRIAKAPIQTPLGRSLSEKSGALKASMKSLATDTKGVQSSTVDAATTMTNAAGIKHSLDFGQSLANEAKLNRAIALERGQGPAGPGGMGGGPRGGPRGGPSLENNRLENGPRGPNFEDEETAST